MEKASSDAITATGLEHQSFISHDLDSPLAILVHGKAGNDKVMSIFHKYFTKKCNIIYPQAPLIDPIGGYSWWLEDDISQVRAAGLKLLNFINEAQTFYGLKPKKLIACGFSQGGAVISWISQKDQKLIDSMALLASFYIEDRELAADTFPDTFVTHGYQDAEVSFEKAKQVFDLLTSKGAKLTFVSDNVAHKVGTRGMKLFENWLKLQL